MSYQESAAGRIQMPQSRYILPEFEERTSYGFKRHNPYTKLCEDRIVFLGVQLDDAQTATSPCTSTLLAGHSPL